MSFLQRLHVFSMDIMQVVMMNKTQYYTKKYVPEREPKGSSDLLSESAMWWYLYDISVGYPRPNMPNTIDIVDMMARPAKHLPKEYTTIMDASTKGVILVSLGSHFDHVPDDWLQKFCAAFNSVKYTVIWKLTKQPPCDMNSNIIIKSWVPQNDLLAHPKLRLFITHCGINSLIESVSHGTPMLGFPITLDQPYNAALMENKGYGKTLQLKTFAAKELIEAINDVMGDDKYTQSVRKASEILHSKQESPGKRMSFWVDYIIKYGDSHLRTKAHDLSLMEFLMVDIFIFLFVCCICLLSLVVIICACCVKCFKRCCRKSPIKEKLQ